ncbi:MAG: metal ABC transporter ATP-binding protein [Actinomycetota bacterium]
MSDAPAAVRARGAAVAFGARIVWRDVDLDISAPSFTAILGPNGAGKSTFIKAMLGLQELSAGRLEVLGASAGKRRRSIGYVPQHAGFDRALNIRGIDIVRLGLDGDRWGIPFPSSRARAGARARIDAMIELVGATAYANAPVGRLSGGEQQRLLIAQALVRDPQLLLLDEPLDNLDLSSQSNVSALLQRICRERGVTVVMVAHDVNPILAYLDNVIYFAAGRAVAGAPRDVITTETLTRLYGTDVEVLRASDGRLVVVGQPEAPAYHSERHDL